MPKPQEIAVLEVGGQRFQDWETVTVRRSWGDPWQYFQFTAAERDPVFKKAGLFPDWQKLQFKPGDPCSVYLANQLAITGFIEMRQVAYDAHSHGVMLSGKSYTAPGAKSSVDTKTGSFDNKTMQQVAVEVWTPYGVKVITIGTVDQTPFKQLQCNKGELVWDFLERIARDRHVRLACNSTGQFLLIGQHGPNKVTGLVEGKNILSCQCIIDASMVFEVYDVHGSSPASDGQNGTSASEQQATAKTDVPNVPYSKLITPIEEHAPTQAEMQMRADFEKHIHDGQQIVATITVQGWLREDFVLWQEGEHVFVNSPMAMLNEELAIQQVIFTQDDKRGSLTVLTCVNPSYLNAHPIYDVSKPAPQTQTDIQAKPPPGGFPKSGN
jgi:prophage tail gpP-like protein